MNCLYITLFFNIVAGIVQTFIKSWNQSLYPRVIEVCRLPFDPRHDFLYPNFSVTASWIVVLDTSGMMWCNSLIVTRRFAICKNLFMNFHWTFYLLRWEIVRRNAPHIWRDFGSALPFQTRLTQTKPVLPLSNEHGSQVKDQGRRQCCHNKHKNFPYWPTRDVSLLSRHASYINS